MIHFTYQSSIKECSLRLTVFLCMSHSFFWTSVRSALPILSIALPLLVCASTSHSQISVSKLRVGLHSDKTRLVLELSEEPSFRVFTLPNPYRVVIDLPEFQWQPTVASSSIPTGIIKNIRFGLFAPGTSRFVLDFDVPVVLAKVFVLAPAESYPYRLVIDLKEVSPERYATIDRQIIESKRALPKANVITLTPVEKDERVTIVLDAGHGGVDPGAIGLSGVFEKAITLAYTRTLKDRLEESGKYRVLMTRDRDVFVKLDDRWRFARDAGADLFLSLHADSHHSHDISGASVFTLSDKASDEMAAALAESANRSDLLAGIDLAHQSDEVSSILLDLTRRETSNLSVHFASMLVESLGAETELLRNPHRFAGFVVLKAHDVPSVLVEIGFLSNPTDETRLRTEAHRHRVTKAIADSIEKYFAWQQALR